MNRKSNMQQEQIVALFIAGESIRNISKRLGIHRDTVSGYVKARGFLIKRGRPAKTGNLTVRVPTGLDSKPTIILAGCPPGSATDPPQQSTSQSLCEPYREFM